MAYLVAATLAIVLTALDLDKTFYIPRNGKQRARLWALWWGFCVANGAAAAAMYQVASASDELSSWHPLLLGSACGLSYLALLRLKFTTFRFNESDVPFGFEAFYEAARTAIFGRINTIAQEARYTEAQALAESTSLGGLARKAYALIENDALSSEEQKEGGRQWLAAVLKDAVDGNLKKDALANFILSGRRSTPPKVRIP